MTTPKIRTLSTGGSRWYVHPTTGEKCPGVTSVLNMLPKPFLKAWAAKEVATTAVDNLDAIRVLAASDRQGAIDYLKGSPNRNTRAAADIGTAAHGVFEALSLGHPLPALTDEMLPYVRHFSDFLDKVQPTYRMVEETIWSDSHSYAGSFDAFAEIQGHGCWVDNKTTRSGVHAEVALQLSAYSHADFVLRENGTQVALPKAPAGGSTRGVVVHVRPEGWALYEVPIGDDVFEFFLALRKTFVWDSAYARQVVGKPIAKGAAA